MSTRASPGDPFGEPVNLGPTVNSSYPESGPRLTTDGLTLFFASDRPGGQGNVDLWVSKRAARDGDFGEPVNLGPLINSSLGDGVPALSADGLTLFFASDRPGGQGDLDLWMSTRASPSSPFGKPLNLGPLVNSPAVDTGPFVSADGLTLLFCSKRPGGQGGYDIWMAPVEPPRGVARKPARADDLSE
jgi:Tol biopolymer transport system component